MRFELSGSFLKLDPLTLIFIASQDFDISFYLDLGYTNFDVICIGGAGGMGGGINAALNNELRNYGGAGGGGGFHRVKGLLSALPTLIPIVVGAGGTVGAEHVSNPALTTDGGDGGYSSFNGTTCRASGGKGGKRAQSNSTTVPTEADGGQGGIGDSITAGGGADGGLSGIPTDTGVGNTPGTDGKNGLLEENIGAGGGGGAGGVGKYPAQSGGGQGSGVTCLKATAGGRGSYVPGERSYGGTPNSITQGGQNWASGYEPNDDPQSEANGIIPGGASGASAGVLTGLSTIYGLSKSDHLPGDPGVVVLRMTVE